MAASPTTDRHGLVAERAGHGVAIHAGQADVAENNRGLEAARPMDGVDAGVGDGDLVAGEFDPDRRREEPA
jgi:hypothetical protein